MNPECVKFFYAASVKGWLWAFDMLVFSLENGANIVYFDDGEAGI